MPALLHDPPCVSQQESRWLLSNLSRYKPKTGIGGCGESNVTEDDQRDRDDALEAKVRAGDPWAALAWTRMRSAAAPGRLFARFPPWARWLYLIVATAIMMAVAIILIASTS
jgi:hypothetical protein